MCFINPHLPAKKCPCLFKAFDPKLWLLGKHRGFLWSLYIKLLCRGKEQRGWISAAFPCHSAISYPLLCLFCVIFVIPCLPFPVSLLPSAIGVLEAASLPMAPGGHLALLCTAGLRWQLWCGRDLSTSTGNK